MKIRQSKFYLLIFSKTGFLTFVGQPIEDGLAGLPVGGHHIHPYLVADGLDGFLTDNLL